MSGTRGPKAGLATALGLAVVASLAVAGSPTVDASGSTTPQTPTLEEDEASEPSSVMRWRKRDPRRSPPKRTATDMVYDSQSREMVLFGGKTQGDNYGTQATWTWNGRRWKREHPETRPDSRSWHAMAYDPVRGETVLYGGWYDQELFDTWLYKDGEWERAAPTDGPGFRQSHAMAFDPRSERVILFGGVDEMAYQDDTWAWDGQDWTELHPDHVPSARAAAALAYDPKRNAIVLYGGGRSGALRDTWHWDGDDWIEEAPRRSPLVGPLAAATTYGRHLILFGGYTDEGVVNRKTWMLKKNTWQRIDLDPGPVRRGHAAFAWDSDRREAVLFGGTDKEGNWLSDTWALQR